MPQSIRDKNHSVYRKPQTAIEGDIILVECRSPGKWKLYRGSGKHKIQGTVLKKNAYAVLTKAYTNLQKP